MAWVKFKDKKTPIQADVYAPRAGIVNVRALNLTDYSGFQMYADRGMQVLLADYSEYTTKYKEPDKDGMYASTGEVYQEPEPIPEPEPAPEPTPEEQAEQERQEKITVLQEEISTLKMQIDSTDYKIIKAYEYSQVGLETEYDMVELHQERQEIRDEINALEENLNNILVNNILD